MSWREFLRVYMGFREWEGDEFGQPRGSLDLGLLRERVREWVREYKRKRALKIE